MVLRGGGGGGETPMHTMDLMTVLSDELLGLLTGLGLLEL